MYFMPVNTMLSSLSGMTMDMCRYQWERMNLSSDSLDTEISKTPYDVVYHNGRVKVKKYHALTNAKRMSTPLLVVYALINRETMLDLQPERSVVQNLLKEGVDLYMIDWGSPTQKDKYQTISDHVNGYIDEIVDFIRHRHQVPKVNLMGVCMGGTFSVIYAALHPDKVKNLITTVTPTNFETDTGLLHVWSKHLDADQVVKMFGNLPGDVMNFGFLLMNPARLMIDKYKSFYENLKDKEFVENFI